MRRLLAIILSALVLGVALGVGTAVLRIRLGDWSGNRAESARPSRSVLPPERAAPRAAVDQEEFNFGVMDDHSEGSHDFVVSNRGGGTLTLRAGATSCRCARAKLEKTEVPPGQSAKVAVQWHAREMVGRFRQTASIFTNDPDRAAITLAIVGEVTATLWCEPPELILGRISAAEPTRGEVRLMCGAADPLKITGHTLSDPQIARFFDVACEALPPQQGPRQARVRSSMLVRVTVKPGLPQGAFQQTIRLQTNVAALPTFLVPVKGIVGGDIVVAGEGWNEEMGIVNLGTVSSQTGTERKLLLIARGPHSREVKFRPVQVLPELLSVAVGETKAVGSSNITQTPLIIQIPKGSPPANHTGSEQGKLGIIVLETGHPQSPRLRILVQFVIEG